jgi:hypothetical protein
MNWLERTFSGSFALFNHRLIVYGFNAMHVAIDMRWRSGWICFHPPMRCFGKWWPWYLYFSPDATPQQATWKLRYREV